MRLLVDSRVLKGTLTGVETYVIELLTRLARLPSVQLTALCRDTLQVELLSKLAGSEIPCEVARSPFANLGQGGSRAGDFGRFDVLHCPTPLFPFLRKPRGPRVVCTVHDVTPRFAPQWHKRSHALYFRWALPRLIRHVDHFLADSRATANDLARWYHVPETQLSVVPLASRWPVETPLATKKDYLLAVGTVEPRKNLERTVAAFTRFKAEHPRQMTELLLVGKGGWGDVRWNDTAQQRSDIRWTGYVDDQALRQLYREARALVYPSLYEGFGLPVLEALSLGCPVITSNTSSLPEVGGDAVLYVDPEDTGAIAHAIARFVTEPGLAEQLAIRGQQRAAIFSWERVAAETVATYRRALSIASPAH